MSKVGLFFGTQTGKTESVAEQIRDEFGGSIVTLHDIAQSSTSDLEGYQYLIIGCPTWNVGELQSDWEGFFPELDDIDFSQKTVAYFGTGDQIGYSDNFLDAIGILEEKIAGRGGKTVGKWPTDGYDFSESRALRDGEFVGLGIDEDNQPELTERRIKDWVSKVKSAFGL